MAVLPGGSSSRMDTNWMINMKMIKAIAITMTSKTVLSGR